MAPNEEKTMGYWAQTADGESFADSDKHIWGDLPADVIDGAISKLRKSNPALGPDDLYTGVRYILDPDSFTSGFTGHMTEREIIFMTNEIEVAKSIFRQDIGREPTAVEIMGGVKFSAGVWEDETV